MEDLNPQLLATIEGEFAKVDGQAAPVPTRTSADVAAVASQPGGKGKGGGGDPMDDLFPRVDLDKLVAGTTIVVDAKSDAWKTRKEALELLQSILDVGTNKRLKPNMGDIGQVLKARVVDSNKIVQNLALDIITRIATGMNKPFDKYTRFLAGPVASILADQKATTRAAAMNTLNAMATACEGIDTLVHPIAQTLESPNPILRSSLLGWMAEWLKSHPDAPPGDIGEWASPVVHALDDKSGEVRKSSQAILPFLIASCGYDTVLNQTNSMKAASRASVLPIIQAAKKSAAPSQPAPLSLRPNGQSVPAPTPSSVPSIPTSSRTSSPPMEPPTSSAPAAKRTATTSLRMRKLEPASRPESRAETIEEDASRPPSLNGSRILGKAKPSIGRPTSTVPKPTVTSPAGDLLPFAGSSLDAKRARLAKDGVRWIVEGLPVRKDLPDILHQQLENHSSATLKALLFSRDHNAVNDYVKGLGVMGDCFANALDEGEASDDARPILIANSDLALKYASIRIHEPQPNLIVRCLDVLDNVIALLAACDYSITDAEAFCFVPTLIYKVRIRTTHN